VQVLRGSGGDKGATVPVVGDTASETLAGIAASGTLAPRVERRHYSTNRRKSPLIPPHGMSQKCLVTGAAGFIGSHLIDCLLERGATVLGLDNLKLGRRANLAKALENPRFKFVELDVNDAPAVIKLVAAESRSEPFDTAWHMAANSDIRAGVTDPDVDLHCTFLTTYNLLKVVREQAIPRLAFASTSAIYGVHPGLLHEDLGPLFPISNYGAMKLASEAAISAAVEAYLQRAWIFRFPNVVGSRSTHGVIYDFAQKLKKTPGELEVLGDGLQEKPYFHVSDLVEAMLYITDHAAAPLNCFNIGTADSATTVRYIAEAVVKRQSPGARIRYTGGSKGWVGDVPKFIYSIEKLRKLGWSPRLTSNQAVDQAVEETVAEALRG
jgi:UDP-glucose 4-epimerase